MTKPHEETWTLQRYVIELGDTGRHIGEFVDDLDLGIADPNPGRDRDRAQLAAQAPAMARLLLRLVHEYPGTDGACMLCGSYTTQPHGPKCEAGNVLRAAGVIE